MKQLYKISSTCILVMTVGDSKQGNATVVLFTNSNLIYTKLPSYMTKAFIHACWLVAISHRNIQQYWEGYATMSLLWQSLVQVLKVHYKAVGISIASENQGVQTRMESVFDVGIIHDLLGSPIATERKLSKLDCGRGIQKVGESIHNVTLGTLDWGWEATWSNVYAFIYYFCLFC